MSERLKKKGGSTKVMWGFCVVERIDGVEVSRGVIPLHDWETKSHTHGDSCPHVHISTAQFPQNKTWMMRFQFRDVTQLKTIIINLVAKHGTREVWVFFLWVLVALIKQASANKRKEVLADKSRVQPQHLIIRSDTGLWQRWWCCWCCEWQDLLCTHLFMSISQRFKCKLLFLPWRESARSKRRPGERREPGRERQRQQGQ